ncbi:MAG: outer membrane protein [Xanthobacteraceae bacterium]
MKKLILAAALLVAGPAYAGDMPRYNNAPQVYQNLFNWTGFYAGLNTGLGWGDANGSDVSGYAIGGQIGYNYQLVSGLVFGAETDITITGIDGATASGFFSADYIGTLRGRLGYAFDRVLLYATGGFAYAGGDLHVAGLSNDQTHYGYALGFGIEGMIAPNISARLEYLYTDFGSRTYQTVGGPVGVGFSSSLLRAGVNYRF